MPSMPTRVVLDAINRVFHEALTCDTHAQVAGVCLEVAQGLTGSRFGFIDILNDAGKGDCIAISDPGWDACRIPHSDALVMLKDMEIRGIWGEVIKNESSLLVNDPASHPASVGTPDGHAPIRSFLGVPLKRGEDTIGLIALANKESGYDRSDQEAIEALAVAFVEALSRKRAEEAVRSSEQYFRSLLHSMHEDIIVIDRDLRVTDINRASLSTTGHTRDEVIGRHCYEVSHGYHKPCREYGEQCPIGDVFETGRPRNCRHVHMRPDGSQAHVDILLSPLHDDNGNVTHVIEAVRDVTDLFEARRELQALLRLNETTVANIPMCLLVLDRDLNVIMANREYLEGRGIQLSDVAGKNIQDVFPSALLEEQFFLDQMREVAANGGRSELSDLRHTADSHPEKRLDIQVCSIHSPEGHEGEPRVLLLIEDVTTERTFEEQMHQAAKLESIGRLAGGVAHDFNNLLTGIKGYAHLLLNQMPQASAAHADLVEVGKLTDRAEALTRQLLAFSRRQPLEPTVLSLNDLAENAVKMIQRVIGEDVDLRFTGGPDLGTVRADPGQIEQILMNLAVNARDAMPEGGKLTIETANVDLGREYADSHVGAKPGRYVGLAVSDTGTGMDEDTREHIFEPFFTTKEAGKGTGLGLSTVYGIVKQHGGNVWVYSELGKGTTFKIYLPRVDAVARPLAAKHSRLATPRGSETILLVEDEAAVRDVSERLLKVQGYTVLCAASADAAEEAFAQHGEGIALLLTDVVLPDRSGRKLYERLAARQPSLKVLYMSGYTDNAIVHHGVLDEDTPFMQKPFDAHSLGEKVRDVLDN